MENVVMGSNKSNERRIIQDFDEWVDLAKNNPEEFEAKRVKKIEAFLSKVPEEKLQRLRGLQWQIDQTRKLARTPMASCIAISNMMWESAHRLKEHHYELVKLATDQRSEVLENAPPSATIIPMNSRAN
jgi:hypothetical protein